MRELLQWGVLLSVSLFAACTCISTEVKNRTTEPVFVSEVSHSEGQSYEDYGYLVMPGEGISIAVYGEDNIRARDMRGYTVFYAPVPENEDSDFDVTSLEPVPDAAPIGKAYTGRLGFDSPWSLVTCRDGDEVKIPLFGLLATVKNESSKALVVNVDEYPGATIHNWKSGVFAAPGQTVQVFENVTEQPYLRAFDQQGRLVYMEPLPLKERPTAVIPKELPLDQPARPVAPYDNGCLGMGWLLDSGGAVSLAIVAIVFGAFMAGALVALFITIRFFWGFYVRRGPG